MKFVLAVSVIWIVALAVTAMPSYHLTSHHKHSKSRDLSNEPYPPEDVPEDIPYESTGSNEAPPSQERDSFGPWKSWEPTHEDYGSDENADLFGEEIQDDLHRPTKKLPPTPYDPCKNVFCHYGRVCRAMPDGAAMCECADASFCVGHHKPVCGSDGVWYPSHCELHRQACLKYHHIQIDHAGAACEKAQDPQADENKENLPFEYEQIDREQIEEKRSQTDVKLDASKPTANDKMLYSTSITKLDSVEKQDSLLPTQQEQADEQQDDVQEPECSEEEYAHLKQNLLQYHCSRVGEDNCFGSSASKQFVVNIMFTYYDRSSNNLLDTEELYDVEQRDHLGQLSKHCSLTDIMVFDDVDDDQNITLHEFYEAFDVSLVHLEERLKVFSTAVTIGNNIELKCDIKGASEIIWKRNGGMLDQLPNDEITVFQDGSLYIGDIGLHHLGNYSCQDKYNDEVIQTHTLRVQTPPMVKVWPLTQVHTTGTSFEVRCRANGVPEPKVVWERNEQPLPRDPQRYTLLYNNATLEVHSASYSQDTGAYKCKAKNAAGRAQDIATVFIENAHVPNYNDHGSQEEFIVFHDSGYTVYDPKHCYMEHQVIGSFSNFAQVPPSPSLPRLCEDDKVCSWGSVVNARNKLAYVSQPTLNRIVVVAFTGPTNPVQVIETDATPVKLLYVEHLDQVWILCWNGPHNTGSSSIMVVRDASNTEGYQTASHIESSIESFDVVNDLFLPLHNDLENRLSFGYVTRPQQQTLYKLDLRKLKYVKMIDLQEYECVPKSVALLPLGGKVMVYCVSLDGQQPAKNSRLVLDYITDQVLDYIDLAGEPYVSPDGRRLVTVDRAAKTLAVYNVDDVGKLEHVFDEYTSFHMSDITFYPSQRERGYDLFATSSKRSDILYVNLASGKVEIIEGVGEPLEPKDWPWTSENRAIVTGGAFAEYLVSPSKNSVIVIDGRRRHVQCEWQEIYRGNVVVWVEPPQINQ